MPTICGPFSFCIKYKYLEYPISLLIHKYLTSTNSILQLTITVEKLIDYMVEDLQLPVTNFNKLLDRLIYGRTKICLKLGNEEVYLFIERTTNITINGLLLVNDSFFNNKDYNKIIDELAYLVFMFTKRFKLEYGFFTVTNQYKVFGLEYGYLPVNLISSIEKRFIN